MRHNGSPRWHRTVVVRAMIGMTMLSLIAGPMLAPDVAPAHAGAAPHTPSIGARHYATQRPRVPARPSQSSIEAESAWFQLSHFGRHHPAPGAYVAAQRQAAAVPLAGGSGAWTPLGPQPLNSQSTWGLVSGRITAIAVNHSNDVWVGAADGGVWHSTDGDQQWQLVTATSATLAVGAIAIDPNNSQTIYVGTGEGNANIDGYWGVGVLKSTDGGLTWNRYGYSRRQPLCARRRHRGPALALRDRGRYCLVTGRRE